MEPIIATGISVLLLAATVLTHYELLRLASGLSSRLSAPPRARVLVVIAVVLSAHLIEIGLYAVAFAVCQTHPQLGALAGEIDGGVLDIFYFSITTYTTLGIGDVHPRGALRLIAGVESLNGLVLIGWSASFTYLTMEQYWEAPRRL
jgi:hypothetical protein